MKKEKYNPSTGGMNIAGEIETQNLSINYKNAKKKKTSKTNPTIVDNS